MKGGCLAFVEAGSLDLIGECNMLKMIALLAFLGATAGFGSPEPAEASLAATSECGSESMRNLEPVRRDEGLGERRHFVELFADPLPGGGFKLDLDLGIPLDNAEKYFKKNFPTALRFCLPKGRYLVLYSGRFFRGSRLELEGTDKVVTLDLRSIGWDDKTRSVRIESKTIDDAVGAAIGGRGRLDRFFFHGHHFNLGPWKVNQTNGRLVGRGRITHSVRGPGSHHVDFAVSKGADGRTKLDNLSIKDTLESKLTKQLGGLVLGEWLSPAAAEALISKSLDVLHGKWEAAVVVLIHQVALRMDVPDRVPLRVLVHLQNRGDVVFNDRQWAGTKGEHRAVEGFEITPNGNRGVTVTGMAHLAGTGDTPWLTGFIGTRGQDRRVEGIALKLQGPLAHRYSIRYRVHMEAKVNHDAQGGDSGWQADGAFCGTRGQSRRVEAIYIEVIRR